MKNMGSASRCVIVVALGVGACFTDKGATTLDATVSATGDDMTSTGVMPMMPTTGGSSSGTTGSSGSGTSGDTGPGTSGGGTTSGTTVGPTSEATIDPTPATSGSSSTGEAPPDPAIEAKCQGYVDVASVANGHYCMCRVVDGTYNNHSECMAEVFPSASYWDCFCAVYAKYPEANAFLDCAIPIIDAYGQCLKPVGCEQEQVDACNTAVECPEVPATVELMTECGGL